MRMLGREGKVASSEYEALGEELGVIELGKSSVNREMRDWK